MSQYDLKVGDEVTTIEDGQSKIYIIINYKPGDNWVIVLTKAEGWHYALRANTLIPTGQHYQFSDELKRELEDAMTYKFNISKRLLTEPYLQLVTT